MEKEQTYYFLEIPLDDPDRIMHQLGRLGLKEELENGPSWLHSYLHQSIKNGVVEEQFLVSNKTIWQWDEIVHQEYWSDPEVTAGLLRQLGIPKDAHIPVLRLTDETLEPVLNRDFYAIYSDAEATQVIHDLTKLGLFQPENQWLKEENIRNREDELLYIRGNSILRPEQYQGMELARTPVFMLNDLIKIQHLKDIVSVMDRNKSENSFRSIPFERRTMEVCVAAIKSFSGNIKQIGGIKERDVLYKVYTDKISPLFDVAKDIRPWAIGTELFLTLAALDERCVALPLYENLPKYGVGITRKDYDYIRSVSSDNPDIQRFKDIPYPERNYLISSAAVQAYGRNLNEVPADLKTPALIMIALEKDGLALEFVRIEKMTGRMIDTAIENSCGEAIRFVPEEARTRELCLRAMEQALNSPDRDRKLTGKILKAIPDANVKVEAAEMVWQSNINRYKKIYNQIFDAEKKGELYPGLDKQQMDDIGFISTYPLSFIPEERYTQLLCDMAILGNGDNIRSAPENLRDDEIITSSLCKYGEALQYLPDEKKTFENCLAAASGDHYALHFVPEKFLTKDLCRIVVQTGAKMYEAFETSDSIAILEKIPYPDIVTDGIALLEPHLNTDKLLKVIEENTACLKYIPNSYKTQNFYNQAVNLNGWALEYVPEQMKTKEMCLAAKDAFPDLGYAHLGIVSHVPYPDVALEFLKDAKGNIDVHEVFNAIRKDILNNETVETAISLDPNCFKYVPDELKTEDICKQAIKELAAWGEVFDHIPGKVMTDEIYKFSVDTFEVALSWIPEEKRTYEMCKSAVTRDCDLLQFVPEQMKTHEICKIALDNSDKIIDIGNYNILQHIPYSDICLEAISKFESGTEPLVLYSMVHNNAFNEEIVKKAVQADGLCIAYIPEKYLNEEIAAIAIDNTHKVNKVIQYIPDDLFTSALCEKAVMILPESINFLPKEKCNPELYLKATMNSQGNSIIIPKDVENGRNIYSFFKRIEKYDFEPKLNYQQISDLYKGNSMTIPKITHSGQELVNRTITYNKDRNSITCTAKSEKIKPVVPEIEIKKNGVKL